MSVVNNAHIRSKTLYQVWTILNFQSLDPELEAEIGAINLTAPKYSVWTKAKVHVCVCMYI